MIAKKELPVLEIVMLVGVMAAVIAVGILVVRKFRDQLDENQEPPLGSLSNFREMHERGDLSDDEYRTIKTALAGRLEHETKDSGHET